MGRKRKQTEIDPFTRDILDRIVRIKTRARVKDAAGNIRVFRSTIAEKQEGLDESESAVR